MATINYTVRQTTLRGVGYENYSQADRSVVDVFTINSTFDETFDTIELHVYGLNNNLLTSNLNYRGAQQLQGAENGARLTINPEADAIAAGFDQGGVKLLYNFLRNISPEEFFIQEISADRTELKVLPVNPTFDATDLVAEIKDGISTGAYFNEFRLNFGGNDLLIGLNIDINNSVLIKLYEPLPSQYSTKSRFTFDEIVSDSVVFEIEAEFIPDAPVYPTLRGANFNLDTGEEKVQPTEYFDYNDLYSYDVTSSLHGVITQLSSSGVELSIDYTDYLNFVHFSSAEERLRNFNYKMGLLEAYNYSASISATYQPQYDNLTKGIISKFDDYEKYLYFKSGSKAWPKTNSNIPYINDTVTNSTSWFNEQVASASLYDELNESRLTYTVPEFIREDSANEPYNLFLDMIGQHFDNLWIYSKAMTDKYDADNRLDVGVSKDLIRDVLKSFGVKLYTSNFSVSNLAASFIGEFYQSGSEQINTFVTASNDPTPDKDILSETYKRIYHNLPYLIKTKGTERGLRALINCFGIPSGSLEITEVGGYKKDDYFFNRAETADKIRLDNTGSLVSGSTLSQYVSIQNNDEKYTQDSHQIDVAFTSAKYINTHIENQITGSYPSGFNIDEYIGDPTLLSSGSYVDLNKIATTALSGSDRYDMFDFVRLVKFFDNQLFKMVKDFVPARAVTTTGITVKPHILNRSKIVVPTPEWSRPEYSGSIDTAFTTGSEGGVISATADTTHTLTISTKSGLLQKIVDNKSPQFNGELGGTALTVTTQSLNIANQYKDSQQPYTTYNIQRDTKTFLMLPGQEDTFRETEPASGQFKVRYLERESGGIPIQYEYDLLDGTIHKTSSNGVDVNGALNKVTAVYVLDKEFVIDEIQEFPNHYYFKFITQVDVARVATTSNADVVFRNYVAKLFYNSDYNVLINNAVETKLSNKFSKVDRVSGDTPQNLNYILYASASGAEVQDSNYDSFAYKNIRYDGVSSTSTGYNVIDGIIQHRDATLVDFAYGGGTYPEMPEAGGMKITSLISVRSREDITQIFPGQAGFTDALKQAIPELYQPKIKQYSTNSLNAVGAKVLAHGFTVPSKSTYYIASGSATSTGTAEWVSGAPSQIVFKNSENAFASKVGKNNSGYYVPAAATSSFTELVPLISASITSGERWFVSLYYDLGEVAQGTLTPINDGYTTGPEAYGAYEIESAAVVINGVLNLKNPILRSGQIGFGSSNAAPLHAGMLIWKAVISDEHILFSDATLSGVGKGAMIGNNPTDTIDAEFEYLTKTYGSNPN